MDEGKKPKCGAYGCSKTSQYTEGYDSLCVGCLTLDGRKHATHKRMELQILSDITRGVKQSLPDLKLTMVYDAVYHDRQRPDLETSRKRNLTLSGILGNFTPSCLIKRAR